MGNCDPYSDSPSLWSSINHSLLGPRGRHCYAITWKSWSDVPAVPSWILGYCGRGSAPPALVIAGGFHLPVSASGLGA
jgi:hypothetical protein